MSVIHECQRVKNVKMLIDLSFIIVVGKYIVVFLFLFVVLNISIYIQYRWEIYLLS